MIAAAAHFHGPHIAWAALSPLEALIGGSVIVLLVGLLGPRFIREQIVPALTLAALGATIGLTLWQWHTHVAAISGALAIDPLTEIMTLIFAASGIAATLLSWRGQAPRESAHGDFFALMLGSIAGMVVLVAAQNLVTLFVGLELLSIPLYVLCATEMHRAASLESGLKYLIIGSVGSATLVYGLALLYGATGSTDFGGIASSISHGHSSDTLVLTGVALLVVGLAFKASIAPFHQWTPDVYEGAPTPVTAFMSVATKAAAFGVLLRVLDVMLPAEHLNWRPALLALAAVSIIVGNVGALGQSSLKRLLAYSSVAQAGYILAGVAIATTLGARATILYLIVYLLMNLAAFAAIIARERATPYGDDIDAVAGLGAADPWLAWPLTIAMLALAGVPATAGFIGKFFLIDALVGAGYTWLAIVIVVGSMISLGYYLRVISAVWMRPAPGASASAAAGVPVIAGGSPEADALAKPQIELRFAAVVFAAATVFFGIVPQPLFNLAAHAARTLGGAL
ncbi:MAG: NADH-quinone oxidoreductase subunit N [Solirubrobacteraceae bacterium]|jgi:NADH-quinone oxidoreductase subunit N